MSLWRRCLWICGETPVWKRENCGRQQTCGEKETVEGKWFWNRLCLFACLPLCSLLRLWHFSLDWLRNISEQNKSELLILMSAFESRSNLVNDTKGPKVHHKNILCIVTPQAAVWAGWIHAFMLFTSCCSDLTVWMSRQKLRLIRPGRPDQSSGVQFWCTLPPQFPRVWI